MKYIILGALAWMVFIAILFRGYSDQKQLQSERDIAPCEYFSNYQLQYIPGRCVKELLNK